MTKYRGDEFVGLDDDCIGDGVNDAMPCDTWMQNRIQGNTMYLNSAPESICWAPISHGNSLTAGVGERPWASIAARIVVGRWRVRLNPFVDKVEVTLFYNVQAQGGSQSTGDIEFTIGVTGHGQTVTTLSNTYSGGPSFDGVVLTHSLGEVKQQADWQWLYFKMISQHSSDRAGTANQSTGTGLYSIGVDSAGFFDDSSSGNPDADSLEVQYVTRDNGTSDEPDVFDLLFQAEDLTNNDKASVYPENDNFGAWSQTVQRHYMAYLQLKSAAIRWTYKDRAIIYVPQAQIAPNIGFSGVPATMQAQGIRDLYRRPRLRGVGPAGVLNSNYEEYQGLDYPIRWPFALGDQGTQTLIEDSIFLDTDQPSLKIVASFVCVHTRQPFRKSFSASGETGEATWDLTATVDQLDDVSSADANWASDTTVLESVTVDAHPFVMWPVANNHGASPLLRQVGAHDGRGANPTMDMVLTYKEGSLYPEDLDFLQDIVINLDLDSTYGSARRGDPVRVKLDVALDTVTQYVTQFNVTSARVRLLLISYSIHEIPKVI